MDLHVAKWGNSLALRLPAEYVRSQGIKDGDRIEAVLNINGGLTLRLNKQNWNRIAFAKSLAADHEKMEMGTSVVQELRRGGAY
jgi:antitoxin MazE